MAKRSPANQSKHDKKVEQIAKGYQKKGYGVKADLKKFEQPKPIGKYNRIPDIEATKNGRTKIIEVETEESLKADSDQQATFRRSVAHKENTTFEIKVAK